jgi:hypothetical protein
VNLMRAKIAVVGQVKVIALLALAHYVLTWMSLFALFSVFGHIDEPRSASREQIVLLLSRTHDVLQQPLAHPVRGESNLIAHLRVVLNSLLWGTVAGTLLLIGRRTLLLIGRRHQTKGVGT